MDGFLPSIFPFGIGLNAEVLEWIRDFTDWSYNQTEGFVLFVNKLGQVSFFLQTVK